MHLRVALGCSVICALLAAGPSVAAPDRSASQRIDGKTSQGRPFKAVVAKRSIQINRFVAELRCKDGTELLLYESGFLPTPLGGGGRVHDYQYGRTDKVWIRGRVAAGKFSGRLRVTDRLGKGKNRTRCDSGWFTVRAR